MNIGKQVYLLIIAVAVMIGSCGKRDSDEETAEKYFQSLGENQARLLVQINGKEFYSDASVFGGQILLSDNVLNISLTDQFGGKTMLSLAKEKWYEQHPIRCVIEPDAPDGTSLKIGKIIDKQQMIGEGYMMTKGEISAPVFTKDKMIFKIKGEVGKYSDFQRPDQFLPVEGMIVYKKPAVSLGNITEKEAFSSMIPN